MGFSIKAVIRRYSLGLSRKLGRPGMQEKIRTSIPTQSPANILKEEPKLSTILSREEIVPRLKLEAGEILGPNNEMEIKISKKCNGFDEQHLNGFRIFLEIMRSDPLNKFIDVFNKVWIVNRSIKPLSFFYYKCFKGTFIMNLKYLTNLATSDSNPYMKELREYAETHKETVKETMSELKDFIGKYSGDTSAKYEIMEKIIRRLY